LETLVSNYFIGDMRLALHGTDAASYLGALAGLLAVGIAASLLPARRAATSDRMEALRAE
jgi:ABC-type lipoprotein release transport system permease subunit